jgi:hypothetical protein
MDVACAKKRSQQLIDVKERLNNSIVSLESREKAQRILGFLSCLKNKRGFYDI